MFCSRALKTLLKLGNFINLTVRRHKIFEKKKSIQVQHSMLKIINGTSQRYPDTNQRKMIS